VQEAVVDGSMSVKEAARLSKMPAQEQNEAVAAKKSGSAPAKPRKEKEETVPLSEFTKMEDQYNELVSNYDSIALQLEAYSAVANDESTEKIRTLQAQVITLTKSRDEWQNKCNEMSKQIRSLTGKKKATEKTNKKDDSSVM
jgi:chromosome segregation ATPase